MVLVDEDCQAVKNKVPMTQLPGLVEEAADLALILNLSLLKVI